MKIKDEIDYQPEGIQRKVVMKNESGMVSLMAFDKDTFLDTHFISADIFVEVLEGTCEITVDGNNLLLSKGDYIKVPAGAQHSLCAPERFKILATRLNLT